MTTRVCLVSVILSTFALVVRPSIHPSINSFSFFPSSIVLVYFFILASKRPQRLKCHIHWLIIKTHAIQAIIVWFNQYIIVSDELSHSLLSTCSHCHWYSFLSANGDNERESANKNNHHEWAAWNWFMNKPLQEEKKDTWTFSWCYCCCCLWWFYMISDSG